MSDTFQREFLNSLDHLGGLEILFENLPELSFFVKDLEGRHVLGNQSMVRILGKREPKEILGHTDYEFFPRYMADRFRHDDLEVMRTGERIIHRIEPITSEDGTIRWYATNKVPVYGRDGKVIGVAGITQHLNRAPIPSPEYMEFSQVVEHIHKNYSQSISIEDLAHMASLSVSQFERRFKRVFQESPMQFILKVRVNEACKALIQTRNSVSWIAQATGFCDQSYFSKQFVKRMGVTPREYRQRHYQGQPLNQPATQPTQTTPTTLAYSGV